MRRIAIGVGLLWTAAAAVAATRCLPCHSAQVNGFAGTPMAQSLRPVSLRSAPEFAKPVQFLHPKTGRRYRAYMRGPSFVLEEFIPDEYSDVRNPVYVIGSGAHARSFLVAREKSLFEAPVTFYAQKGNWDMSPGYDGEQHVGFTRPVNSECLFCHTGSAATPTAIDCERCHGPSDAHRRSPKGSIVNPAKLKPAARDQVCEQCHLMGASRVVLAGRKLTDYQAGGKLEEVVAAFQFESAGTARVTGHPEQMKRSRCYTASAGRMWCGSCHQVHTPLAAPARADFYRARCLECHTRQQCGPSQGGKGDCVSCHMPKIGVLESTHVAFTNHEVRRRPAAGAEQSAVGGVLKPMLPPPSDAKLLARALGIAYLETSATTGQPGLVELGLQQLEALAGSGQEDVDYWQHRAEAYLKLGRRDEAEASFERAMKLDARSPKTLYGLAFLRHSAGRLEEAVQLYRRALASNGEFLEAWRNLAVALHQMKNIPEAREALRRVLALNPGDQAARRAEQSMGAVAPVAPRRSP